MVSKWRKIQLHLRRNFMETTLKDKFYDLIINQGVYGKIKGVSFEEYINLISNPFSCLDLYCPICKSNKTFVYFEKGDLACLGTKRIIINTIPNYESEIQTLCYQCPNCRNRLIYIFLYRNKEVIKIGQFPSLYDISRDDLKQYQKNKLIINNFDEIYKADICASTGYFVASYTYIRRVFEVLLKSVFDLNRENMGLSEEAFKKLHADKKLEKIKPFLAIEDGIYIPLYSLLSEGIHALTEEECGKNYTLLKAILLNILFEQKTKEEKISNHKLIKDLYSKKIAEKQ